MRDIKFRFWFGHTKKMTYPHTLAEVHKIIPEFTDDIVPLEYTGRTDKYKTEIYEGDIIAQRGQKNTFVEYHNGKWVLRNDDINVEWRQELHNKVYQHIKIIGNIYETPNS